jgi:hypothetical protein
MALGLRLELIEAEAALELRSLEGVPLPTSTHWLPIRHASH